MIKVGNTQINPDGFVGWTKAQFKDAFAGKLSEDIDEVWAKIVKARPKKKGK